MWVEAEQNDVMSGEPLAGDVSRKAYAQCPNTMRDKKIMI